MKTVQFPENSDDLLHVLKNADVVFHIQVENGVFKCRFSSEKFGVDKLSTAHVMKMIEDVFADKLKIVLKFDKS